jgi:hypothetical protein
MSSLLRVTPRRSRPLTAQEAIDLAASPLAFHSALSARSWYVIAMGVGHDYAGVDRESFAPHDPFLDATRDYGLKQFPQQIALAEAAVAVLGERRMIGDVAVEPQGRPTSTSDEPRPSSSNAKGSPVAASRRSLPAYGPFWAFGPPGCPKTYFRVDQFNGVDSRRRSFGGVSRKAPALLTQVADRTISALRLPSAYRAPSRKRSRSPIFRSSV